MECNDCPYHPDVFDLVGWKNYLVNCFNSFQVSVLLCKFGSMTTPSAATATLTIILAIVGNWPGNECRCCIICTGLCTISDFDSFM